MERDFYLLKQMPSLNLKPWVYGRHLENSIWRQNSATDRPISTKFGRQM